MIVNPENDKTRVNYIMKENNEPQKRKSLFIERPKSVGKSRNKSERKNEKTNKFE